ncbi:phage holin family protein [Paenibacillus sp. GCM10027626]|uniref:phage holin family protein n=1 Tax=Paenibacillus sp. GCM10027626 TaxID=3273411 RepID=UPI00362FEBBF
MDFVLPDYIDARLMGIVLVCMSVGLMVKQTPRVPDYLIVYIVTAVAIVLSGLSIGWSANSVVQGILCGSFSVYGHQVVKQIRKRESE